MKIADIQAAEAWFFSLTLQIDWATIYKDVTSHENNWISLYLSNSQFNCKVIVTGNCRKFSCILLYLHGTPCMEKKTPTGCGAVRRKTVCSFPWQDGIYSWHLLYPRMRDTDPSNLHFSLLFHHFTCGLQVLHNFISLKTSTLFFF